jgi:AraC-like DNA-binding protein
VALLFTTAEVRPHERFDLWTAATSRLYTPMGGEPFRDQEFWATVHGRRLGAVELTNISAAGHVVMRTPRYIAISDPEVFWISLQLSGTSVVSQEDRIAVLRRGDLVLYDSSHPYAIRSPGRFDMAVFQFPRTLLRHASDLMAHLTGTRVATREAGAFVVPFLRALAKGASEDTLPDSCEDFGEGVIDLANAIFSERVKPAGAGRSPTLLHVKAYIKARLGDPGLTPGTIARANYISTRRLYKLFAAEGVGVAEWIRRQRLERCRRDLRAPALRDVPIARIALDWGFRSPEHFSRAFAAAYGTSPSEYRGGAA